MFATILSWLVGGGIASIGEQINRNTAIRANAKNATERVAAEKEIAEKEIARLEARRDILLAEQGNWITRWIRPAFAFPFVIYNFKIVVWDKVLGLGATDPLTPEYWQLQMVVFGAYFLTRGFEKK